MLNSDTSLGKLFFLLKWWLRLIPPSRMTTEVFFFLFVFYSVCDGLVLCGYEDWSRKHLPTLAKDSHSSTNLQPALHMQARVTRSIPSGVETMSSSLEKWKTAAWHWFMTFNISYRAAVLLLFHPSSSFLLFPRLPSQYECNIQKQLQKSTQTTTFNILFWKGKKISINIMIGCIGLSLQKHFQM